MSPISSDTQKLRPLGEQGLAPGISLQNASSLPSISSFYGDGPCGKPRAGTGGARGQRDLGQLPALLSSKVHLTGRFQVWREARTGSWRRKERGQSIHQTFIEQLGCAKAEHGSRDEASHGPCSWSLSQEVAVLLTALLHVAAAVLG